MKPTRLFSMILAIIMTFTLVDGAWADGGRSVYLPIITNNASGPSSFDLIDQAVQAGQLTAEQGLIYKVYALFSDAQLPAQYVGSAATQVDGDLLMEQVVAQSSTLSDAAKTALTPFFVPPSDARSWYYRPHLNASAGSQPAQASGDPDGWTRLPAAGGQVLIGYWTTNASDAAKAAALVVEFNENIYPMLTQLMNQTPMGVTQVYLWSSYIDVDGTVVRFDNKTLGITVPATCDASGAVIYLPDGLPLGSHTSPGLMSYAAHEFMHAIQFAYPEASCSSYNWLKEATASWAEDYVYPHADSEHELASRFMNYANHRLDYVGHLHEYGAYLLFYYLTHAADTSSQVIRQIWENAGSTPNSYKAIDDAVNTIVPAWHTIYWQDFLISLWNQAPFGTFYQDKDNLADTVQPVNGGMISATGGEVEIDVSDSLPTGGARFHQFTVDSNVSSLTILNGWGKDLTTGDASSDINGDLTSGDEDYQFNDLTSSQAAGTNLIILMKVAGKTWMPVPLNVSTTQLNKYTHCIDLQGKIESLVIIQSNWDYAHPNRVIAPVGLPTRIVASNLSCRPLTGTARKTIYNAGVKYIYTAQSLTYGYPSAMPDISQFPYADDSFIYPSLTLNLLSASGTWSVSGNDGSCSYSGQGTFSVGERPGEGYDTVTIFTGLVHGSPSYRGYEGAGEGIAGTITFTESGPNCPGTVTESSDFGFLEIPLTEDRAAIKVPAAGGALTGSYKRDEPGGDYELMEWNLTPQTQ
jgi:hypothetical protein